MSDSPYQSALNNYSQRKPPSPPPTSATDLPAVEGTSLKPEPSIGESKPPSAPPPLPQTPRLTPKHLGGASEQPQPSSAPAVPPLLPEETKDKANIFKYVFFLSLVVFLVIVGSIIFTLINKQTTSPPSPQPSSPSPTDSGQATCQLNDREYKIGESFLATDGCNTCTCQPNLIISCTNKDCRQ